MGNLRKILQATEDLSRSTKINWYPGHMFSGKKAMMGKLNTVDCIVEVHDSRIPFTGRNQEFKRHLGLVKPRILVLNKSDLADLSNWKTIKEKLRQQGDSNVVLSDLTGSQFAVEHRGYTRLLQNIVDAINNSDRNNRSHIGMFKIMVVGIPNVGKSTLINRLRQFHLGKKGSPAETGAQAGVTKSVQNAIKVCSRPPIYTLDTPGVLEPGATKNYNQSMRLALCSTITDKVLNPIELSNYLLKYLNLKKNHMYLGDFGLDRPVSNVEELFQEIRSSKIPDNLEVVQETKRLDTIDQVGWRLVKRFRNGMYGKFMFDSDD